MKKSEAIARQEATIEELLADDRNSPARQVAEEHSLFELLVDGKEYDESHIRNLVPYGNVLRELVVAGLHGNVAAAPEAPVTGVPDAVVVDLPVPSDEPAEQPIADTVVMPENSEPGEPQV